MSTVSAAHSVVAVYLDAVALAAAGATAGVALLAPFAGPPPARRRRLATIAAVGTAVVLLCAEPVTGIPVTTAAVLAAALLLLPTILSRPWTASAAGAAAALAAGYLLVPATGAGQALGAVQGLACAALVGAVAVRLTPSPAVRPTGTRAAAAADTQAAGTRTTIAAGTRAAVAADTQTTDTQAGIAAGTRAAVAADTQTTDTQAGIAAGTRTAVAAGTQTTDTRAGIAAGTRAAVAADTQATDTQAGIAASARTAVVAGSAGAAVLVVICAAQAYRAGLRPDARVVSVLGAALLGVLLVAAAHATLLRLAAGARAARTGTTAAPRPGPALAISAALLAGAGPAFTALPRPAVPLVPGVPLLATVSMAGRTVPVLAAPGRPGWNLVHVPAADVAVGTSAAGLTAAAARPGASGAWAEVYLPPGRSRIWVGVAGATGSFTIDTGRAAAPAGVDLRGDDGPECATVALGAALADRHEPVRSCPADRLTAQDAGALRATARFVAGRGVTAIGVLAGDSPRGAAAREALQVEAARLGLAVHPPGQGDPLFVLTGWAAAAPALDAVAGSTLRAQGVYLAPWLLSGPLLTSPAGQLIPLRFDTNAAPTLRYVGELRLRFTGEAPSAAGWTGWTGAAAAAGEPAPRLHATARIFLPSTFARTTPEHPGHDNHGSSGTWVPQGTITEVTGPLDDA